jgi:F-box/leucine-rich repeat protein 2/20
VVRHCPELRRLDVFDCQHVSRSGIEKLKATREDLRIQAYFAPSNPQPTGEREGHRTITCRCCAIL